MSKPTNVDDWLTVGTNRYRGKGSSGVTGNRKSPLPYHMVSCRDGTKALNVVGGFYTATDIPNVTGVYHTMDALSAYPRTRNAAYSEFFEKVHGESTAQLMVLFGEMKEASGMIAKRLLDMCEAVKFIRDTVKGKPSSRYLRKVRYRAYQARNTKPKKKPKKRFAQTARDATGQLGSWQLEWSFGWAPTISEIQAVSEVFSRVFELDSAKLFGRAGTDFSYPQWAVTDKGFTVISQRCTSVRVVNPNLALANSLGLVNPGAAIAELIPFSFLADWAFDYSTWISSLTDTLGYEISEPYITTYTKGTRIDSPGWPFDPPSRTSNYVAVKRELGLIQPYPNFDVVGNIGDSFRRVLNAASLLAVLTKEW